MTLTPKQHREINLRIAAEFGFNCWFHATPRNDQRGWKIIGDDGHSLTGTYGWPSEEKAWDALFLDPKRQWSLSLTAAWSLLLRFSHNDHLLVLETLVDLNAEEAAIAICTEFLEQ